VLVGERGQGSFFQPTKEPRTAAAHTKKELPEGNSPAYATRRASNPSAHDYRCRLRPVWQLGRRCKR
jgi:hypothetical protein